MIFYVFSLWSPFHITVAASKLRAMWAWDYFSHVGCLCRVCAFWRIEDCWWSKGSSLFCNERYGWLILTIYRQWPVTWGRFRVFFLFYLERKSILKGTMFNYIWFVTVSSFVFRTSRSSFLAQIVDWCLVVRWLFNLSSGYGAKWILLNGYGGKGKKH